MAGSAIEARHLFKKYDDKYALQDLSLDIPFGRVCGILGANGAGKSTFFRIIMGLVKPDSGDLSVLGQQPGWRTNAGISYLPDRARWYHDYTAEQSLQWGLNFLPGFDLEEARRLAEWMKLPLTMKASAMSKGQEARLMLILCMARTVPLVILDEPFSGIDGISREKIIESLIDAISEKEQTLLISTHEIHEAEGLFDDVVFLDEGCVRMAGDAETLRREYGSINELSRKLYR